MNTSEATSCFGLKKAKNYIENLIFNITNNLFYCWMKYKNIGLLRNNKMKLK